MPDEALAILAEPMPCDTCEHACHCAATGSACEAFSAYVKGEPWDNQPREPDVRTGRRLGLVTAT